MSVKLVPFYTIMGDEAEDKLVSTKRIERITRGQI